MLVHREHTPIVVAALSLAVLPFVLDVAGLPLRSAVDVVVFAIACMGLNILVGYTGLVSFGHGAWFGLGAYAAALSQRYWFPGDIILPTLFAILFVAVSAMLSGALILRRRGVYFSLLTLALTALLFAIAYRWTELTGGESGLGGVTRSRVLGVDLENDRAYYVVVAAIGLGGLLSALAISPLAGRQRAGGDPRERAARPLRGLSDQPLQARRLCAVRRRCGAGGRLVGLQSSLRLGRTAGGRLLGRAHRHGGDRRDAQLPWPRPRCPFLHPISRVPLDLDAALAVLFRPAVRRLHRVLAVRPGGRRRAADRPVPQA